MPYTLQFKRYSTVTLGTVTGAAGEIIVDSTKKTVTIHDGATVGGMPLATEIFVTSAVTSVLAYVSSNYVNNSVLPNYVNVTSFSSTLQQYALSSLVTTVSSYLTNYTQNINLTSTLTNYTTNANLTSTLTSYQLTTSTLTLTNLTANTVTIIDSSNATSVTSGALRVKGGLSLTKDLFIGGGGSEININNILTIGAGTISRSNGDFYLIGGGGQLTRNSLILSNSGGAILWGGSATNNSPATTGIYGIRLAGGDGNVSVINSSDSTSISTGSLVVNGGLAVAKTMYVSNIVVVNNVTASTITVTGTGVYMPNRPAFRVIGNGGAISATTTVTNAHWVLDYQQGTALNTSTGIFTAPVTGLYQVNVVVRTFSNTNTSINQIIIYKYSGTSTTAQIMVEFGNNTSMNHAGGSTISRLDAGDQLRFIVAVGTISFDGNDNWSVAYIG